MGFTKRTERPSNKALLGLRDAGWTHEEIANRYGRGRSTITKWLQQADAEEEAKFRASASMPRTMVVSTRGKK